MKPIIKKLGKVSITPQGDYDVGRDYNILDTINDNGKTFIARKNVPKGTPTSNKEYWMEIASGKKGDKGEQGNAGTIENVNVTIDNKIGIPTAEVVLEGTPENRIITINFKNLKGETGASIKIISNLNSESELPADGNYGDAYLIDGDLYLYVGQGGNVVSNSKWNNSGTIKLKYEDLTQEQIEDLQKPAIDAANILSEDYKTYIKDDYDNTLKPNIESATNSANNAADNANRAAQNVNTSITEATEQANYAKEQGDNAKTQADYAKREADRLSSIDLSLYRVVTELPSIPSMSDDDKNKIYLKISIKQGESNKYDEYIVAEDIWELLGQYEAAIDLTEYVGKTELKSELAKLDDITDISKFICIDNNGNNAGIITKEKISELLGIDVIKKNTNGIVNNGDVDTLNNYISLAKCIFANQYTDLQDGIPWYSIGFDATSKPFISGYYGMTFRAATGKVIMSSDGRMSGPGFIQSSDSRLKSNINNIDNVIDKIKRLKPCSYTFNSDKNQKERIGLIAQEVEEVFPQFVYTNEDGYKSIDYASMVSICIKAIQELLENNNIND